MNKEEVLEAYLKEYCPDVDFDLEKEFYIVHDLENTEEITEYIKELAKDGLEEILNEVSISYNLPFLLKYVDFKGLLNEELSQYSELSDYLGGEVFEYNGKEYFIEFC